jgi:hypothetical protein
MLLGGWIHWPGGADFKCDDYAIIRYVGDFDHVLHDFVGPQYDLEFFRFWRPFITLSFWIDHQLFGIEPFGYFAMNCLALLLAAALLFAILTALWRGRGGTAFAVSAVLLWLCHPASGTALRCWAAGRVDSHYVPPLLLALLLHLRYRRGGSQWPVWIAAAVAIGTKEAGLGFPLLAIAIDLLDKRPPERPTSRATPKLLGRAVPAVWYLVLFPLCFLLRYMVLDSPIGGYHSAPDLDVTMRIAPGGMWHMLGRIFFPETALHIRRIGSLVVVGLTLAWILPGREKLRRTLATGLVVVAVLGPIVQLFEHARSPDLRLAYFPTVFVIVLWVGGCLRMPRLFWIGRIALAISPLLWFVPAQHVERERVDAHDAFNKSLKAAMRECDAMLPPGATIVVADDEGHAKNPFRFGWGFGSVMKPPFRSSPREVVTLRSIPPGLPRSTADMVAAGLPAWVEVTATGGRVVTAPADSRRLPRGQARPVGFSGVLTLDLIQDRHALESAGFAVDPGFTGTFAVCTTLGATTTISSTPDKGFVSLAEILFPVADQFWVAMDLDKDSPFTLVFADRDGVAIGKLTAAAGFARKYVRLRWPR